MTVGQSYHHRYPKDTGKLTVNPTDIREFWQKTTSSGWLDPNHPGKWGANPIGLYGDDAKYNKSGEKFISICWNCILQKPKRILEVWIFVFLFLDFGSLPLHALRITFPEVSRPGSPGLDLARFPCFILRFALAVPDYTLIRMYQVVAWSLQAAWPEWSIFSFELSGRAPIILMISIKWARICLHILSTSFNLGVGIRSSPSNRLWGKTIAWCTCKACWKTTCRCEKPKKICMVNNTRSSKLSIRNTTLFQDSTYYLCPSISLFLFGCHATSRAILRWSCILCGVQGGLEMATWGIWPPFSLGRHGFLSSLCG